LHHIAHIVAEYILCLGNILEDLHATAAGKAEKETIPRAFSLFAGSHDQFRSEWS